MIDEKGLEAAALEFKRHHRNCCYPEALGGEATRAVHAIITAYLSAKLPDNRWPDMLESPPGRGHQGRQCR